MILTALKSGVPLIAHINSQARLFATNWLEIVMQFPQRGHVLNIIGFNKGLNPFTNKVEEYFIVRDSFVKEKINYKVSAKKMITSLATLIKLEK